MIVVSCGLHAQPERELPICAAGKAGGLARDIAQVRGLLCVGYRSSHGLRPGCELLPELTAAGPGSPVRAGTRRHPAATGLAHAAWFKPGHGMTSPQVPAAAGSTLPGVTWLQRPSG